MSSCSVPNCRLVSDAFFSSPKEPARLELWQSLLGIQSEKFKVCHNHFDERVIKKRKIGVTFGGFPTLFLPAPLPTDNVKKGCVCQCCLKLFDFNHPGTKKLPFELYKVVKEFREPFESLFGFELLEGSVCGKCYRTIIDFNAFRETILKTREVSKNTIPAEVECIDLDEDEEEDEIKEEPVEEEIVALDDSAEIKTEDEDFEDPCPSKRVKYSEEETSDENIPKESTTASPYTSARPVKKARAKTPTVQQFKCNFCDKKYSKKELVIEHLNKYHAFKCKSCPATFAFEITCILHQSSEHKVNTVQTGRSAMHYKFNCSVCDFKFISLESLSNHMLVKHNIIQDLDIEPEVAVKVEPKPPQVRRRNRRRASKFAAVGCPQCNKFFKPSALEAHQLKEHDGFALL